jgi:hypothetical protein
VGGPASVVLGGESSSQVFQERQAQREAVIETPDALPRFSQAPGGAESSGSDGIVAARGPVGGAATVSFGSDDAKAILENREAQRHVVIDTPDAAPRFTQAPGGAESKAEECLIAPRGPVGGAASIVFTGNGVLSDAAVEEATATRGPVGGEANVCLGSDNTNEIFASRQALRNATVPTPDALPRFSQAPGGTESQSADGAVAVRGPVGGECTVVFGNDNTADVFAQCQAQRCAAIETPEAAPRFSQVPGGFESDVNGQTVVTMRGPVGGAASIVLGGDNAKEIFDEREAQFTAVIETPAAAPRFTQAPGGTESVGCDAALAVRGPVGGADTVNFGSADAKAIFDNREAQRHAVIDTPDAAPRFTQAPGGSESQTVDSVIAVRGPVGGASTVILGGDDTKTILDNRQAERQTVFDTPDAAPRFQQAPGGAESQPTDTSVTMRGAVGGTATIVLGGDDSKEMFVARQESLCPIAETPDRAPRFQQAPGGDATVVLGGDELMPGVEQRTLKLALQAPGGTASIVLGADMATEEVGVATQKRASLQIKQAPGGTSTLILGSEATPARNETSSAEVSANKFATGSNQNCGNTITERPTTRLHHAPGGASSICLGDCAGEEAFGKTTSANKFASGANQNAGNVLTDRSTTRLHHAPGGASTICFGYDETHTGEACDENINTANLSASLDTKSTLKPSVTMCSQAPGGNATILLG